ncbi:MAG: hypothetical protein J6Z49_04455 [Kiritimatiellae bacterium]|nr:hypothetical protein [Kiritimatiellia bacterium]
MTREQSFEFIKNAILSGRSAQAYLITGNTRGDARRLAVHILQMLFCTSTGEKPCGTCDACHKVANRVEVDVHWVFPEKKSRIISVEQIRTQVLGPMTETSFGGGWKAAVISNADCMRTEAANAFLKTLEEPVPKSLFILLSDAPQKLLPTVISRCQRIDLDENRSLPEPWEGRVLDVLAGPVLGSPTERLASANMLVAILAEMQKEAEREVREEGKQEKSTGEIVEEKDVVTAKVSARYREMRHDFMLTVQRWFRDLMILTAGGDETLVYNQRYLETLKPRAARLKLAQALYNVNAVDEMDAQLEKNMKEEHVLAYAIDRIHHGVPAGKPRA